MLVTSNGIKNLFGTLFVNLQIRAGVLTGHGLVETSPKYFEDASILIKI